jgi:membrane dipeptidase
VHHVYSAALSIEASHEGHSPPYEEVEYVKGVENPTEASKNILRWLVDRDYSDRDIEKVLGGNILRVLKEVWQ